jgi:hypothetical protein
MSEHVGTNNKKDLPEYEGVFRKSFCNAARMIIFVLTSTLLNEASECKSFLRQGFGVQSGV